MESGSESPDQRGWKVPPAPRSEQPCLGRSARQAVPDCPGRKPPKRAVKRLRAHTKKVPYKTYLLRETLRLTGHWALPGGPEPVPDALRSPLVGKPPPRALPPGVERSFSQGVQEGRKALRILDVSL
jgi:hypothetical protein